MLTADRRQTGTPSETLPIWMAALIASGTAAGWQWLAGRAVYTNGGAETETIEPFGVQVQRGETVAVTWHANDSSYTVEFIRPGLPEC